MSLTASRAFLAAGIAIFGAMLGAPAGPEISPYPPDFRTLYAQPIQQWPPPWIDAGVAFEEFALPPSTQRPVPGDRRAALGGRLFHDPILSAGQDVSCASCHRQASGWSTASAVATGHGVLRGRRNPPSLYVSAWSRHLAWDGGEASLAAQSLRPLTLPDEMANPDVEAVLKRLGANAEFGDPPSADDLADALVAFLKTLDTPTRFDRFLSGERGILTDREIFGLHLFRTKARCANCHFGPLLADGLFHNLKISFFGEPNQDLGRYDVTGRPGDAGRFRTPSLRHVSQSAPYMHNGLFPTLEGVVNLYDRGGGEVWARNAQEAAHPLYPFAARLSPHIRPLNLSPDEKAALAAFLRTL